MIVLPSDSSTDVPLIIPAPTSTPEPTLVLTPTANEATTDPGFQPGIYHGSPISRSYDKFLMKVEEPGLRRIFRFSNAFDIRPDAFVSVGRETVTLIDPNGGERQISVQGILEMNRPSFSPDGKRVAVQARDTLLGPEDFNIYIVDLENGEAEKISFLSVNEESPEWFPNDNRIAYSSFSQDEGIKIHIYDVDAGQELSTFGDGAIHLAISPDGRFILNPQLVRLYDVAGGSIVSDLKDKVMSGLDDLGYQTDTRFPGQADRGTFPLDADFSPDSNHIVFDGAVERDGAYGVVIFQMTITGDEMTPLTGMIDVDPAVSNNHNYSQLNPSWLGT